MLAVAVAVCSFLRSTLSKFTGFSSARVSVKFMAALLAVLLPCSVMLSTTSLHATSNIITVNNLTDPASTSGNGFCTLREAIDNANASSDTSGGDCAAGTGTDTIRFSLSGTITLAQGTLPAIANTSPGSLTIDGTGQTITIDGGGSVPLLVYVTPPVPVNPGVQVMSVNTGATLNLNLVTIADGNGQAAGQGGAGEGATGGGIANNGTLTVTNSTFTNNSAGEGDGASGGAIANNGTLTVTSSTFSGNQADPCCFDGGYGGPGGDGGAIVSGPGSLTVTNSIFSNNSAGYSGQGLGGAISSYDGPLMITNSTFSGNTALSTNGYGSSGGAVFNENATTTVTNSNFSNNSANSGGAINGNDGTVTNSNFSNNSAVVDGYDGVGGGIVGSGTVTDSTFVNNSASIGGAMIFGGTVTNSTFSGNTAFQNGNIDFAGYGGAIETEAGSFLTVTNSTFINNSAFSVWLPITDGYLSGGGAIDATDTGASVTVTNSTFSGNSGSAVLLDIYGSSGGTVTVSNSIFAKSALGNCDTVDATITDGGNNIADDATCGFGSSTAANGDTIGDSVSDNNLALAAGGLANNGGLTETIALELGSYAIAAIPTADCPATDQRGATRPAPGYSACDIGAFEYAGVIPTATPTTKLVFGSSLVGHTATKNITVRNTGPNRMFIGSVISNDPGEFFAAGATTCPPGGLAVGLTCTIAIGFTPEAVGARSAILTIYGNTAITPESFVASGTGTVTMTVTPASYEFGSVKDGSKAVKVIVVHNYQANPVSLSKGFSGPNATDFSVTGGTCTSTLAKASVCTAIVTFAPTAAGAESATMTVTDSPDPLGPYTVSLSSAATVPESVSPAKLAFADVYQTASKTLSVTLTNHSSSEAMTLTGTSVGGANASDFAVTGGNCTGSLAASSSCTYAITFTPQTESAEAGTFSIMVAQDPNGGPPAVALSGTGLVPIRVVPASIALGTVADGHSSVNRTVTVINDGGAASLSELVSGPNSGDFTVTGGTCGATLAGAGASCTYTLKFTPSIVGAESATLGVSAAGDAASPHNVMLTGTGS
jgi:hypothetical protein